MPEEAPTAPGICQAVWLRRTLHFMMQWIQAGCCGVAKASVCAPGHYFSKMRQWIKAGCFGVAKAP
eukprot:1611332-Karenia_brevis.AAC.1